jgi:hypothetical protein
VGQTIISEPAQPANVTKTSASSNIPCKTSARTPEHSTKTYREPLTSTVQKSAVSHVTNSNSSKLGSPIPCGDSFFEDDAVLTQTHVNFMAKFQRRSLNGSVDLSNNSSLNSTPVNFPTPKSTPAVLNKMMVNNLQNSTPVNPFNRINTTSNKRVNANEDCSNRPMPPPRWNAENNQDMFDSIDEDMNLQMAEEFEFNYKVADSCGPSQTKVHQTKGNNSSYPEEYSKGELIDEFDDDENFNEILSEEDLPHIAKPRHSRESAGK